MCGFAHSQQLWSERAGSQPGDGGLLFPFYCLFGRASSIPRFVLWLASPLLSSAAGQNGSELVIFFIW
jgi:hypothetical protein